MPEGLVFMFWLMSAGLAAALLRRVVCARLLICAAALIGMVAAAAALPRGDPALEMPFKLAGQLVTFNYAPHALLLLGFGLLPAVVAIGLRSPVERNGAGWLAGAAVALLGALGVFGAQDAYSFLISWELMSLGAAVMLLAERLSKDYGKSVLFMLVLLEFGAVAILLAVLLLGHAGGDMAFSSFAAGAESMSASSRVLVGVLLLAGFGAKLGLLPFYEWLPHAYGSGSGASGAILSGVVLNAAFFALARGLTSWLPASGTWLFLLGAVVTMVGAVSAILAAFFAFQQDDWRRLLAFSTAENASIAVTVLGAGLIFREGGHPELASLSWTVAILHLCGHALCKGGLFVCADAIYSAGAGYAIVQGGWLRRAGTGFGAGALLCVMSLGAIPPQIGFASEWFVFQTLFQGFHLASLTGKLILALAGAGLALTAAVALATFIKLFGVGLLGAGDKAAQREIGARYAYCVLLLGFAAQAAAVSLPLWLPVLNGMDFAPAGLPGAGSMVDGWTLVPLTSAFAFISPTKLVIVMPLLALLPLLLLFNVRRHAVCRKHVWYGGMRENPQRAATTSLSFSNAMRTVYRFVYQPTQDTSREHRASAYFVHKLDFRHEVSSIFDPFVFQPLRQAVWRAAGRLRALQSGDLNVYLALVGGLLIAVLFVTLLQ